MADEPRRPGTRSLKVGAVLLIGAPLLILAAAQFTNLDGLGIYMGFALVMIGVAIVGLALVVPGAARRWLS